MGKGSRSRPFSVSQDQFGQNFDAIFRKKDIMSPSVDQMKTGTCGCGRSPTGDCVGWHALTEEEFEDRKEKYETGQVDLSGKEL